MPVLPDGRKISLQKTLDDLPDKRLGKTRDEATEMLFEHLKKAVEKGYSFKVLAVFWIINRHRDSVELLHSFMEAFPETIIHVCRNLYFGEANRFDIYNNSRAKSAIEQRGMTLNFPAVANRVADWLYSKRCSIPRALEEMPFGTRAETQRWRRACAVILDAALGENHGC